MEHIGLADLERFAYFAGFTANLHSRILRLSQLLFFFLLLFEKDFETVETFKK